MNIKITKELHEELCSLPYRDYLFGSQLHGIATEDSDTDILRVISDGFYERFTSPARYLPNIHSWQYTEGKETQYVWMTEAQFWRNLFSGDGNMISDIILLSGLFLDAMKYCRTFKIIRGYLGVAKRDMKLHGNWEKKRFHAFRSLYMARCLMDGVKPSVEDIKALKSNEIPTTESLIAREKMLREELTEMLNNKEIFHYPVFEEKDELVNIMAQANNTIEFKYEK